MEQWFLEIFCLKVMVRRSLVWLQLNHSECLEILERGIEYNLRNPSERAIQTQKSKTAGHFIEDFCNWNSNKVLDTKVGCVFPTVIWSEFCMG